MENYDVIVLGGGAAGLMCAITAGQRNRRVIVLESSNKIGKKILMSGGGRCNFTNLYCEPGRFVSGNPDFCISALSRYSQRDFIALVEKYDIPYHEKSRGELFCDRSSKDILRMLETECRRAGVTILTHFETHSVQQDSQFAVYGSQGEFSAASLVVATGGLSIPKMGASGFGYKLARQFGHAVVATRAGLVPFTFTGPMQDLTGRLSGVSLPATVTAGNAAFTDDILLTHRGLSGPAALQASSFWRPGESIGIDLLPAVDAAAWLRRAKTESPGSLMRSVLAERLPRSLAVELQALFFTGLAEKPLGNWRDTALDALASRLGNWIVKPAATEGFRTAEVTLGGVDTGELSSKTMESRRHAGLFFIGEVVDVTGHLGGFNFQWAWSSARAAGQVV